ncbi:MAG: hypothetical protein H6R26_1406 [Proteobacteria bacterium]|nr:hypothetical protein [Pseudomonadota bacterium]
MPNAWTGILEAREGDTSCLALPVSPKMQRVKCKAAEPSADVDLITRCPLLAALIQLSRGVVRDVLPLAFAFIMMSQLSA